MRGFGFSHQACDLIYRIICKIWYSFKINGEFVGRFRSFRGVKQGDPLSPMFFIMAQQILSTNIQKKIAENSIGQYKVGRHGISISHLLYADDILLFTNDSKTSIQNLMRLLRIYELSSGQQVNLLKSGLYVGKYAAHRQLGIERWNYEERFPINI